MHYITILATLLSLAKHKVPLFGVFSLYKTVLTRLGNMRAKYIVYRFEKTLNKEDKVYFDEIVDKVKNNKNVRNVNIFDKLLGRAEKQMKLHELGLKFKVFSTNHYLMKYNF